MADRRRAPWPAAVAGALMVLALAVTTEAAHGLAIVGATVIDGTGRPAWADGIVVVDGETIGAVGPRSHVSLPKGIPYLDGRGLFVVPRRLAEPSVRMAVQRRLGEGASFEQAVAAALRSAGSTEPEGAIERGRSADLLVLDKDPRSSLDNLASVRRAFEHGREIPR